MPSPPTRPGRLRSRVRFDKRGVPAVTSPASPDYGNSEGDWQSQFTKWAEVRPIKGGEGVIAARLTGRQPVLVFVRSDSETRLVTTDWRAIEVLADGTERLYNIRGVEDMERKNAYLTLICERGVAEG